MISVSINDGRYPIDGACAVLIQQYKVQFDSVANLIINKACLLSDK